MLPPWDPPSAYCHAMLGNNMPPQNNQWPAVVNTYGDPKRPDNGSGPLGTFWTLWNAIWDPTGASNRATVTSDNVFCMQGAAQFWETCLFIALAFWGFFTVLQLFTAFDIQHPHGHALARTVAHLMRQVILLVMACGSFFLMLVVHQLVFLISDAIIGGHLDQWRVDGLWLPGNDGRAPAILGAAYQQLSNDSGLFTSGFNAIDGGQNPNQPSIFGQTVYSIAQGLASVNVILFQSTGVIRFVVLLLLVGVAPLCIIFSNFRYTRALVFERWLKMWLELEGLAIVTALGIAAFENVMCGSATLNCLDSSNGQINGSVNPWGIGAMQYAFLLLGFTTVVCGLQIVYLYNFMGQLIGLGTQMYQAQYNRDMSAVKAVVNLVTSVAGMAAAGAGAPEVGAAVSLSANTALSAIPQANGYVGSTAGSPGDFSKVFPDKNSSSSPSLDGPQGQPPPALPPGQPPPRQRELPPGGPRPGALPPRDQWRFVEERFRGEFPPGKGPDIVLLPNSAGPGPDQNTPPFIWDQV